MKGLPVLLALLRSSLMTLALLPGVVAAETLVVALKPDKNPEKMLAERAALGQALGQALGREVQVVVPLAAAVIQEGLAGGTIDIGYVSGTEMVQALDRGTADLLLAGEIKGKTAYESLWVVRADSPLDSVASLRGQRIAFASRTSTSGFLIPRWDLHRQGLITDGDPTPFFGAGNIFYGSGYVSAVERVLDGQAEAAAVSDYVIDGDKHLTPEQKARLKVIARQGPVPTHCLAVRKAIPAEERTRIIAALQGLPTTLRDQVFTSALVPVDPTRHLASVREALALGPAR